MKLLHTILFLLNCCTAAAQSGEIAGIVLDEKNQPLVGTMVQVFHRDVLKGQDITDSSGHFLIVPLPIAKYTLVYKSTRHAKTTTDEILVVDYSKTIQNVKMIPLTDQVTDVFIHHGSGTYKAYGPIFEFHYLDAINITALPQTPETTRPSYIHWTLIDILNNQVWHNTRNSLQWQSKK
jgi:hypothetical protein